MTFFVCGAAAQSGPCPSQSWDFLFTEKDVPQSVGILWTSDQPEAEASTWQHTTLTRDKLPCPWRVSKPQSHALDLVVTGIGITRETATYITRGT